MHLDAPIRTIVSTASMRNGLNIGFWIAAVAAKNYFASIIARRNSKIVRGAKLGLICMKENVCADCFKFECRECSRIMDAPSAPDHCNCHDSYEDSYEETCEETEEEGEEDFEDDGSTPADAF